MNRNLFADNKYSLLIRLPANLGRAALLRRRDIGAAQATRPYLNSGFVNQPDKHVNIDAQCLNRSH